MMEDFGNEELHYSNPNDFNEYNNTGLDEEYGEVSTDTENEDMIHIHMKNNEAENNRDAFNNVIEEFPDDTSPVMMDNCGNEELDKINQDNFNGLNETGI